MTTNQIRGYLRERGNNFELVLLINGKKVRRSTGCDLRQRDAAMRVLEDALRELRSAPSIVATAGGLTFQAWGERWLAERAVMKKGTVRDETARLKYHAFPKLGSTLLAALTKEQMLKWVRGLKSSPLHRREGGGVSIDVEGEVISSRYAHHVANTVKQCLAEAVDRDLIYKSPCTWKSHRDLPPKLDTNLRKRAEGGFESWELHGLMNSQLLAEERRVLWALGALTGMRPSETAARRWRDIEELKPYWRIHIATSWNSSQQREGPTKTLVEKVAPVHPLLRHMLVSVSTECDGRKPDFGSRTMMGECDRHQEG